MCVHILLFTLVQLDNLEFIFTGTALNKIFGVTIGTNLSQFGLADV